MKGEKRGGIYKGGREERFYIHKTLRERGCGGETKKLSHKTFKENGLFGLVFEICVLRCILLLEIQ